MGALNNIVLVLAMISAQLQDISLTLEKINTANSPAADTAVFAAEAATATQKLPYKESFGFRGWETTWGSASTTDNGILLLRATASTTGAEAVLRGSEYWTDYAFTAELAASLNGSFSLFARHDGGKNFLSCNFAGENITIREHLDGNSTTTASAHVDLPTTFSVFKSTNVTMKAEGDRIVCSVTGADDAVAIVNDPRLMRGGIGVSIWHSVPGVTQLQLLSVSVLPL